MTDEHPGASSYKDRHGATRWRYKRKGNTISLAGQSGEPIFEEAYRAALEGREPIKAEVCAASVHLAPTDLRSGVEAGPEVGRLEAAWSNDAAQQHPLE